MPRRISFIVSLEEGTLYELRRVWQGSYLSFNNFIEAVMMVGLIQYEGITGSAVEDMRAQEAEEQFLMDWLREEDEDIDLTEQFPEEKE
jgi:hypothetical protein